MEIKAKSIGNRGERKAARYLFFHGYRILARNYRVGSKELDIVAESFTHTVFAEVKTRTYEKDSIGFIPPPSHAVDAEKIRLTRQAARQYLFDHPGSKPPRMDVIEVFLVEGKRKGQPKCVRIHHIKGAY